jgi:methyl halide transferase
MQEKNEELNAAYWQNRYIVKDHVWDIGFPSVPLATYIEQLDNRNINILIPGCGNCYEAELLHKKGFVNVHLLDYAMEPLKNFLKNNKDFPPHHIHCENFFNHPGKYDLILEQTFFCALQPSLRKKYAEKMHELLKDNGRLVGLLFNCEFEKEGPPFGGDIQEYHTYFSHLFDNMKMEPAYNSIPRRAGRELFINFQKTVNSQK